MKIIKNTSILIFVLTLASCNAQEQNTQESKSQEQETIAPIVKVLTVDEFEAELIEETQLIDVRTPEEYAQGHIANAENVDFLDANFESNIASYSKQLPVYIYCKSGGRSGRASEKMKQLGFKKVYDLSGGITNWVNSGNPIIK